jgi:hypothetical protein
VVIHYITKQPGGLQPFKLPYVSSYAYSRADEGAVAAGQGRTAARVGAPGGAAGCRVPVCPERVRAEQIYSKRRTSRGSLTEMRTENGLEAVGDKFRAIGFPS